MKKFLVTGGCGFIGSHLCDRLEQQGHQVRALDNLSTGRLDNVSAKIEVIVGDVADPSTVKTAMQGIDGCFHLAAVASVQRGFEDWLGTHRTNLTGAITVFDQARRPGGAGIPVVYASSAAVYGNLQLAHLKEDDVTRPVSAYGADKLGCEMHGWVASHSHEVATCGLRFFNVFGPRQDPTSPYSGVISIFVNRLLQDRSLTIFGNGQQCRDFVYVDDVVDHLVRAMWSMTSQARVYNVCGGRGITLLALVEVLAGIMAVEPKLNFAPAKPGDILLSIGDPSAAIAGLRVRAVTPLRAGLRRTIESLQSADAKQCTDSLLSIPAPRIRCDAGPAFSQSAHSVPAQ